MSIPWVEIGSTRGITLLSADGSGAILPSQVTNDTIPNMRGYSF